MSEIHKENAALNYFASKIYQAREALPGTGLRLAQFLLCCCGGLGDGLDFFFSLNNYLIFFFICSCYYLLCVEYNVLSWQPSKHLQLIAKLYEFSGHLDLAQA